MAPTEFKNNLYKILATLTVATLTLGTIVYHFVEKFNWVDAYYFSVITLATVGYGDFTPKTTFGKLFTTFYIFIGVGLITTFISHSLRRRAERMKDRQDHRKK